MINYILYTTATGEITSTVTAVVESENLDLTYIMTMHPDFDSDIQSFMETDERVDPSTAYVLSNNISPRPLFSTVATFDKTTIDADGTDSATLGPSLPNPTQISCLQVPVGGGTVELTEITDGKIVIKSSLPGLIYFNLQAFPYQQQLFTVIAE